MRDPRRRPRKSIQRHTVITKAQREEITVSIATCRRQCICSDMAGTITASLLPTRCLQSTFRYRMRVTDAIRIERSIGLLKRVMLGTGAQWTDRRELER